MTQDPEIHAKKVDREGLNWARIAGLTAAIAVHVAALLLLLAPMAPPATEQVEENITFVNLIKQPPPHKPPILVDDPSPVDVQAPPPAPPSPPAPSTQLDTQGTVDPSSRSMNPPKYP